MILVFQICRDFGFQICRDFGVPDIAISEVLPRERYCSNFYSKKSTRSSERLCKNNKFDFISHQQITRDLLYHHGVHLTDLSTEILADNIVDYINNFFL